MSDYVRLKRDLNSAIEEAVDFRFKDVLDNYSARARYRAWMGRIIDLLNNSRLGNQPHALAKAGRNALPEPLLEDDEDSFEESRSMLVEAAREGVRVIESITGDVKRTSVNAGGVSGQKDDKGMERIDVFISHSSKDRDIAHLILDLLNSALPMLTIRCTSVPGYGLPGGASTDDQLRREVLACESLIGIITPDSIRSSYVLFELGARWGAERHMIPLLAKGAAPDILEGPLTGLNAFSCSDSSQLHQMIVEVGNELQRKPNSPHLYQRHIDKIVKGIRSTDSKGADESTDSKRRLKVTRTSLSSMLANVFPDLPEARDEKQFELVLRHLQDHDYLDYQTVSDIRRALERTEDKRKKLAEVNQAKSGLDQVVRAMAIEHPEYVSAAFSGKHSEFLDLMSKIS